MSAQIEFKQIIDDFQNNIETFKQKYGLDEGNIFIQINSQKSDIGGMKDGENKRIPDIGFLSEIEFILAENY